MRVQSSRWTRLHGDLHENPRFLPANGQRKPRPKPLPGPRSASIAVPVTPARDGMMTNFTDPGPSKLPSLPIINPDLPARSSREKYGSLFLVGIAGLVVLVALVGWFGYRAWTMRDVWAGIYVLHDRGEPEEKRLQAAYRLSRDPRVEQRQLWELSLRKGLPELARLILAGGISEDLVAEDPQGYVSAVALSPDWPGWLRLALARPLAYAATRGHAISRERLGELCRLHDPVLRLWALYTLAVQPRPDPQTVVEIEQVARSPQPEHELAELFLRGSIPTSPIVSRFSTRPRPGTGSITPRPTGYGRAGRSAREPLSRPGPGEGAVCRVLRYDPGVRAGG